MVKIHHRARFQAIFSMRLLRNARKPQIWPVSLSQNSAKIRKINIPIPSKRSPAKARKLLRTDGGTDGQADGHAVKSSRLVKWTNGPIYRSDEGISGFGRTDGQPENIIPLTPKGGGIKNVSVAGRLWNMMLMRFVFVLLCFSIDLSETIDCVLRGKTSYSQISWSLETGIGQS